MSNTKARAATGSPHLPEPLRDAANGAMRGQAGRPYRSLLRATRRARRLAVIESLMPGSRGVRLRVLVGLWIREVGRC